MPSVDLFLVYSRRLEDCKFSAREGQLFSDIEKGVGVFSTFSMGNGGKYPTLQKKGKQQSSDETKKTAQPHKGQTVVAGFTVFDNKEGDQFAQQFRLEEHHRTKGT